MILADGINPYTIAKSAQEWVESTVRIGEEIDTGYAASPLAPLVARVMQFALICGMINVGTCNSFPLRMYRKARGTRKRIGGKRLRFLKSYAQGPGRKAAEYAEYAGDVEEVTEHKALALLRNPNPYQSACDFDETAWMHLEFSGNYFQYADPKGPGELYACQPQFTRIVPSRRNFIRSFVYRRDNTRPLVMAPAPVNKDPWCMHFKAGPSLFSPFYGGSWLEAVILELDMNKSATEAEWHRWERGGRPDYHIEAPKANMNREERDEYKTEFRRETQGVSKTGCFLLTSQGWKINPLGFRPKDMDYGGGIEYIERRIRQAAKVSEALLNVNSANVASADAGMIQYARQAILPRLARRAEYTTRYMGMLFNFDAGDYWFCYDNPVPEDEQAETERCIKLVSVGVMTVNEERARNGLPPYPEEIGDVPRFNGVPLATIAQAHPASEPAADPEADGGNTDAPPADQASAAQSGDVQATAMNGAQVLALNQLVKDVTAGLVPEESARAQAAAAYPLLTPEQIDAIFSPLIGFEPRKPEPVATPTPGDEPNGSGSDQSSDGNSGTGSVSPGAKGGPGASAQGDSPRSGDRGGEGDQDQLGHRDHPGARHKGTPDSGGAGGDGIEDHAVQEHDGGGSCPGGAGCDRAGAGDGDAPGQRTEAGATPHARALRRKALAWYGRHDWRVKKLPDLNLTPAADAAMNELAGELKAWFEEALKVGADQAAQGYAPNLSALQGKLETIVQEGLAKLARLGWNLAAEDVGASFELKPESAIRFLEGYKVRFAESISRNLADNLTDAVRAGLETGQTRVEVADAIREVTGDEAAWRADRIARTETSNAIEGGRRQAYGQAGWTKSFDLSPNPCPLCEEVAAANPGEYPAEYVFKGMEDNWFGGQGADVHPNCACSIKWSPPEEET